jgi:hypothetical protein
MVQDSRLKFYKIAEGWVDDGDDNVPLYPRGAGSFSNPARSTSHSNAFVLCVFGRSDSTVSKLMRGIWTQRENKVRSGVCPSNSHSSRCRFILSLLMAGTSIASSKWRLGAG